MICESDDGENELERGWSGQGGKASRGAKR